MDAVTMIEVPAPRLLPVGVDWRGALADEIAGALLKFHAEKYPDTAAGHVAIQLLAFIQEAMDAQTCGVPAGREYLWADNAHAICRNIAAKRHANARDLTDIDHMLAVIARPPETP